MENITLEMSLKPFKQTDNNYIESVCRMVFNQWRPLIKNASCISVLLWTADGSELLDYKGNLKDCFEWSYFVGGANPREHDYSIIDPDGVGLHTRPYLYMENPPAMTYEILKNIVNTLRMIAKEICGDRYVRVGTTFDPGPEFAKSDFKYNRHNEICMGNDMGDATMVCSYAKLNGDNIHYAAFPDGIPEGLPFGTFLGKQANIFMKDIGFDYIWLSNGFGFGRETWSTVGAVFDGERFDYSVLNDVKKDVLDFWHCFRKECPDFPVETRGTNLSMGIDFATDGVPLKEIYNGDFNILPPPNSPWAAMNGDFGLELMGYMSRISKLPKDEYLFRYYLHDPWWINSPWYDRYNSQPHDIYLPLSIARIDGKGDIKTPTHMNLLSIDNSFGNCPDSCVNESMPHLLRAIKNAPDDVAPLVWIYPFEEYSACNCEQTAMDMFFGDWFIRGAINNGLPLSMVVSTDNFIKHDKHIYASSILVSAVPVADSEYERQILEYAKGGGKVIFYGNTIRAGKQFTDFIGVRHSEEVSGKLEMRIGNEYCGKIKHNPLICGGGICEEPISAHVLATAGNKAAAMYGDNFVWIRGTSSNDFVKGSQLLVPYDESQYFIAEKLMLKALSMLGYEILFDKPLGVQAPVIMLHRHDNAYVFSSYLASTTVKTKLKFPLGAPILDGYEAQIEEGYAIYHFPKAEHRECRVFVEQESGIVGCREIPPVSIQYRRRIEVNGLENATIRFLAENYCRDNIHVVVNSHIDFYCVGDEFTGNYVQNGNLTFYEAKNITGKIVFSMPVVKEEPA